MAYSFKPLGVPTWEFMVHWLTDALVDKEVAFVLDIGPNTYVSSDERRAVVCAQIQVLSGGVLMLRRSRIELGRLMLADYLSDGLLLDKWQFDGYFDDCTDGYMLSRDAHLIAESCVTWFRDNWGKRSVEELGCDYRFPDQLPAAGKAVGEQENFDRRFGFDHILEVESDEKSPAMRVSYGYEFGLFGRPFGDPQFSAVIDIDVAWEEVREDDHQTLALLPPQGGRLRRSPVGGTRLTFNYEGMGWFGSGERALEVASAVERDWPIAGLRTCPTDDLRRESAVYGDAGWLALITRDRGHRGDPTEHTDCTVVFELNVGLDEVDDEEFVRLGWQDYRDLAARVGRSPHGRPLFIIEYLSTPWSAACGMATKLAHTMSDDWPIVSVRVVRTDDWFEELSLPLNAAMDPGSPEDESI